ncbi:MULTISPECIES: hypothetical protein [Actinomycetes]|uniref:Uncharacterized protein n=1 Tax=Micromonospora echinofusca TaxID=47858 RepID=A0A1C5GFY1_MICEH|nr:hypothetical protein [Micromonospora echinofusca]SCG18714.1 hypothetical protein GA0070610_5065 [Micromonospora echinofusca]
MAWQTVLFVYALVALPVFVVLGLVAQVTGSRPVRRVAEIVVLSSAAAFAVALGSVADDGLQWATVVMLIVIFVGGLVMHVRSYSRSS